MSKFTPARKTAVFQIVGRFITSHDKELSMLKSQLGASGWLALSNNKVTITEAKILASFFGTSINFWTNIK